MQVFMANYQLCCELGATIFYFPGLTEELENERLNKAALDKNLRTKETELKDTVAKLEDISK